jgi:hypothetical protein
MARSVVLAPRGENATQAGHEVFTPTLTGVGERSHLLKLDINLDSNRAQIPKNTLG